MKYSLSAFYRDFIKEKILKDYLKEGQIPTESDINNKLNQALKSSNDFNNPLLSAVNYYIENGEISSAKKTNETFNAIQSDLNICVSTVIDQEDKISNLYDTSYTKLTGLQNKISFLNKEVDKLLFESKNTDIHEELFYEKFSTKDMVDEKLTTANIDLNLGEITLNATAHVPIDLTGAVDSFDIVPENNPKIINSTDVGEMTVSNIVKNNNKVWMHQLSATESLASATLDLIIRIPSLKTEINKIALEPFNINLKTQLNIEIAYSKDGLNWLFPDGEFKKRIDGATSFTFKGTQFEYWRIRFIKLGNDGFFSNFYVYNFGLKSLNFYGKTYDKVSRLDLGYLYSKPILFKNNIKTANVKVCETIPTSTSINYYLAPIYESILEDVINGDLSPEDLYYYTLKLKDVSSVTLDFLNTSTTPVVNGIQASEVIEYKDQNKYDYCLNNTLPADYAKSQTVILRDRLDQTISSPTGKEKLFMDQSSGWNFDGNFYSTYVLIEDHNGLEIDLGSTQMYINNKQVQGRVKLQQGINFVVTNRSNWKSLDLTILPLEADQILDPLYPYNHKYLIEGLGTNLYGRNLATVIDSSTLGDIIDKDNIYTRTSRNCWAIRMKEVDFGTFASKSKNELDVFSYKIDNTNQERIVVKSDPDTGLINNETFSIITKLHSAENVKGLIFKAVLETDDNKVSPVFNEYMIKIK